MDFIVGGDILDLFIEAIFDKNLLESLFKDLFKQTLLFDFELLF